VELNICFSSIVNLLHSQAFHPYVMLILFYVRETSVCCFPRLGCPKFTSPEYNPKPDSSVMKSVFYPDEVVVQLEEHPRFM